MEEQYKIYTETVNGYKLQQITTNEQEIIEYLDYVITQVKPEQKVLVIRRINDGDEVYWLYKGNYITSQNEWQQFIEEKRMESLKCKLSK